MNIQAGNEALSKTEPTNFTVVRLKRDVLRRSSIGVMVTNRSLSASGTGSNQAYGVDGAFSFFENVSLGAYWARTATTGVNNDDQSYQGRFEYGADRYGARAEFLSVDRNFRPGGRLHASHRHQAIVRRIALQPAADSHQERAQAHIDGIGRVRHQWRGSGGRARVARALWQRIREQ